MGRFRRRKYFIDKKYQTKYILLTVILLLIYTLLFALIIFIPYMVPLSSDLPLPEQTAAARTLLTLHANVWKPLGLVIVIMGILSIFISHRVAGPVYRIKKDLDSVIAGDLSTCIRLRRGDDLQELADKFNQMIGDMRLLVATLKRDHDGLSRQIDDLELQIRTNQMTEESGRAMIERFNESRHSIAAVLEKFEVS